MSRQSELAELSRVYATAPLSNRNLIINGAMQVAQRGDTATNVTANGIATVDRFNIEGGAYDAADMSVSTGPDGFSRALKVSRTTAVAAASGSEYMLVSQVLEAQNLQHLAYGTSNAKKITISFWVKSTAAGTYALNLYANDTGSARTATQTYTIDSANTWEYKTLTFDGDPNGQINNDVGAGMWIQWFLRAGGNYKGTQSPTWSAHTSAQYADGHNADFMSSANGSWELTGVQVEVGDTATPFEHRSYGDELARCQRYYEVMRADVSGYGAIWGHALSSSTNCWSSWQFKQEKRSLPTVALMGDTVWSKGGSTENAYAATTHCNFSSNGYFYFSGGTAYQLILEADSEL